VPAGSFVPAWFACFAALGVATLAACGDDDAPPEGADTGDRWDGGREPGPAADAAARDAATDARADVAVPPIEPDRCSGELPVMQARIAATNEQVDPDWSCYDSAAPTPGDPELDAGPGSPTSLVTFSLEPALIAPLIGELAIDFFFGPSTLGAPSVTHGPGTGTNEVVLEVPYGVETLSARIHARTPNGPVLSVPEFREYGFPVSARARSRVTGYVALEVSRNLIVSSVLGRAPPPDPERVLIVALLRDCQGREVSGGRFELLDETGAPVTDGTALDEPHSSYFQYALPSMVGCTYTSNDQAAWVMVNAPSNVVGNTITHAYRLRLSGRMRASDSEPVVIGERALELFPGAVTFVRLYR
jgi:hypothetical protein